MQPLLVLVFAVAAYYLAPWAMFRLVFLDMPLWGKVSFVLAVFICIIAIGELLIGDQGVIYGI